ncbi:MAG: ankyrin repeat domain-containing protein [Candidatus Aminicenantes bacterium]|nr:ankyrin repeat domain-containing protein [Candidatus Aminicenantes bacterium]
MKKSAFSILSLLFAVCLGFMPLAGAGAAEIHDAAGKGDLAAVKALIEVDASLLNARDADGRTPLHWACRGVHLEVLSYLAEKGSDVNVLDLNKVAPLHSLASRNHEEGIRILLAKKADPNVLDASLYTPLTMAAERNMLKAAAALIKGGAKLEIKNDYGRTPLICCARETGSAAMARLLLDAGADVNTGDRSGATALSLAVWRGKKEMVEVLLETGAAVPASGTGARQMLVSACRKGMDRLFLHMADNGTDVAFTLASGGTLLHLAAEGGSAPIISRLLDLGLSVEKKDRNGWTPLHFASMNGWKDAAALLLDKGADINIRNVMGQTPHNVADENRKGDVKPFLAAKGADQNPIRFPVLEGDYLGQNPPEGKPELFAPGIVSSIWSLHTTAVFSPDGNEVSWAPMIWKPGRIYSDGRLLRMRRVDGRWTPPDYVPFDTEGDVPFYSLDGKRLYFMSGRPLPGVPNSAKERVWYMEKKNGDWADPTPLDPVVNDFPMHWQFSLDRNGNLYFSGSAADGFGMGDIYRALFVDGKYLKPENLGPVINSKQSEGTPFIAPDGSYLLFNRGQVLMVSFRGADGAWGEPKKLGAEYRGICPMVTPDGRYLFFTRPLGEINQAMWVRADIIDRLK